MEIIVRLHDFLHAVRQIAVARENPGPARLQEFLMNAGNAADHKRRAERVVRPAPPLALDADAAGPRVPNIVKAPRFGPVIVPSQPLKHAHVLDDFLLHVQPKAVLVPVLLRGHDVCGTDGTVER